MLDTSANLAVPGVVVLFPGGQLGAVGGEGVVPDDHLGDRWNDPSQWVWPDTRDTPTVIASRELSCVT